MTLGSTTLATYSNLNKASGYVQRSFNVSGFAGQTVTLTFKGVEDKLAPNVVRRRRHGAERQLSKEAGRLSRGAQLSKESGAPLTRRPARPHYALRDDVASLGALLALGRLELHASTLGEGLEALGS